MTDDWRDGNEGRPVADPPLIAADPLRKRPGDRWTRIDVVTGRYVFPESPPAHELPGSIGASGPANLAYRHQPLSPAGMVLTSDNAWHIIHESVVRWFSLPVAMRQAALDRTDRPIDAQESQVGLPSRSAIAHIGAYPAPGGLPEPMDRTPVHAGL